MTRIHAEDLTRDLDCPNLSRVRLAASPRDRETNQALVGDRGDLDAGTFIHLGQDRHDRVDGEMDFVDSPARSVKALLLIHTTAPELPVEAPELCFLQRREHPVRASD